MPQTDFDLRAFLPYLLNQAADAQSLAFQTLYKRDYGLLRTEWRVLFHLGCYGEMTAREICERGRLHKTKVSRAVAKLEARRFVGRKIAEADRRQSVLSLTKTGARAFEDLRTKARAHNDAVLSSMTPDEAAMLLKVLSRMAGFEGPRT